MKLSSNKEKIYIFLCGCAGALTVEAIRLYKLVTEGVASDFISQYFVVIPIFIFIGGIVPILFSETNRKKAFYFGLSLPFIISILFGTKETNEVQKLPKINSEENNPSELDSNYREKKTNDLPSDSSANSDPVNISWSM